MRGQIRGLVPTSNIGRLAGNEVGMSRNCGFRAVPAGTIWRSALVLMTICSTIVACNAQDSTANQQQLVSYAPREPGSLLTPTNELSFRMLSVDPDARL